MSEILSRDLLKQTASRIGPATEEEAGIIRIATSLEAETGEDDTIAITPKKLKDILDATGRISVDITNPINGQILVYNATTDKWENKNQVAGIIRKWDD